MITASLLACGAPVELPGHTDDSVVDVRVTDDQLGEIGPDQLVLGGAEFEVPGASDVMMCLFGTYTGPTVGLHEVYTYQGKFGHHFQILGTTTPAFEHPDGDLVDCTGEGGEFAMADLEPIGIPNAGSVDGSENTVQLPLPEGTAVQLESGQRYVLQSHYVNTSQDTILVGDKVVLTTMAEADVQQWAAPVVFNISDFRIPAGETTTASFRCTTPVDLNLLYADGHMHEWGKSFQVDIVDGDTRTPFYSVPEWKPLYRDAPVVFDTVDDPIAIPAGTTFETTCSWFNNTAEDLTFPYEMCDTVSITYPLRATWICDGSAQ